MNKTIYRAMSVVLTFALILGIYGNVRASSFASPLQASKIYYVSPSGSDLNSCTNSAPCKSFNKVMSLVVSGDSIIALEGTYNQTLLISKSGITVQGNNAIIKTSANNGIKVSSTAQNVVVHGFTVTGTLSHAIYVEGKFVTIEGNTVYHTVLENGSLSSGVITCGNGSWGSAIKLALGSSDVTVRGNTVFENCGEGIAATRSSNVVIENNTVYDNKAVNIYVDNSFNVKVLNNNSYCTKPTENVFGIALGEEHYSGWGAQLKDVTISGNIITNCYTGISVFESDVSGTLKNVTISNNYIPYGQRRGISIGTLTNSNVLISKNTHFNVMWIRNPVGVTLVGNIQVSGTPSVTPTSQTAHTATRTPTLIKTLTSTPTATKTFVPTVVPSVTSLPVSPTAVIPTSTSQTSSGVFYDDTDPAFVYSEGWTAVSTSKAYQRSYMETTENNASVTFTFIGESFSIIYKGGVTFSKFDVYVDGVLVGTVNQKLAATTYQSRWDYPGQLAYGTHTLELVFKVTKATIFRGSLDAVIVR